MRCTWFTKASRLPTSRAFFNPIPIASLYSKRPQFFLSQFSNFRTKIPATVAYASTTALQSTTKLKKSHRQDVDAPSQRQREELTAAQMSRAAWNAVRVSSQGGDLSTAYLVLHSVRHSGAGVPEAKTDILNAAATFWKQDSLKVNIVFDKLMQYQIVDPVDVVAWTFTRAAETMDGLRTPSTLSSYDWMLLSAALDKANGRVTAARRKLAVLRKEDDDNRARANAGDMDVDEDVKPEAPTTESPAVASGIKALSSLTKEQRNTLSRVLEGFVTCLKPSPTSVVAPEAQVILTEKSWHNRASWGRDEWNIWETWSWYRHFCRAYSPYLRNYSTTLSTVAFASMEGSSEPATSLIRKIWNVAVGEE